jgi:hypothetical protein
MRYGSVAHKVAVYPVGRIALGLLVAQDDSCPRHWQTANPVPETGQDSREARIFLPIVCPHRLAGAWFNWTSSEARTILGAWIL